MIDLFVTFYFYVFCDFCNVFVNLKKELYLLSFNLSVWQYFQIKLPRAMKILFVSNNGVLLKNCVKNVSLGNCRVTNFYKQKFLCFNLMKFVNLLKLKI